MHFLIVNKTNQTTALKTLKIPQMRKAAVISGHHGGHPETKQQGRSKVWFNSNISLQRMLNTKVLETQQAAADHNKDSGSISFSITLLKWTIENVFP